MGFFMQIESPQLYMWDCFSTTLMLLSTLLQWPRAHGNFQVEGSKSSRMCSSTSYSVEAFLDYLILMLQNSVDVFVLAVRKCWTD